MEYIQSSSFSLENHKDMKLTLALFVALVAAVTAEGNMCDLFIALYIQLRRKRTEMNVFIPMHMLHIYN